MAEPSLGELASAGQSQEAIPTIAVNNQQDMVRTLNQQAQFKAQNDWNKYQSFLKQKADTLANLEEVEKMDVMTEDRGVIQQDAAKMYELILKNPGAFAGKDNSTYDQIQSMYGGILSKATQSKQDNYFDKENRKYVATNNELNTDGNKQVIESFRTQPLGSRQAYTLNLPTVLDIDAYTKGIMDSPSVKTDYATSEVTPDNQFIIEKTGTKYDKENFMNRWMGGLNVKTDKYGHSISGYVKDQYKALPDEVKAKIPGKTEEEKMTNFWKVQGEKMFGSDQDIISDKKESRKDNTNFLKPEKLQQDKDELNEKIRHDKAMEGIGWERIKSGNKEDDDEAIGVVNELVDIINFADTPDNTREWVDGNGKSHQVIDLADPDLLKKFATIEKDGKITKTADMIRMDKETGQVNLVYLEKDKKGNPKTNKTGGNVIKETKPINARTWAATVVGRNESAKNKGKVNNMVQEVITKGGGLYNLAKKLKGDTQSQADSNVYDRQELKDNNWTDAQIDQAVKAGKIKLK